jgi:hypothetical protein
MRALPTVGYSQLSDFDAEPFDVVPTSITVHGNGGGSTSNICRLAVRVASGTKGDCGELMVDIEGGYIEFESEL